MHFVCLFVCLAVSLSVFSLVYGHCLVTLPTQLMFKMAHTSAHLNAGSSWWWRCSELVLDIKIPDTHPSTSPSLTSLNGCCGRKAPCFLPSFPFSACSTSVLPQWHVKEHTHSANCTDVRLTKHASLTQRSWSEPTMLSKNSVTN